MFLVHLAFSQLQITVINLQLEVLVLNEQQDPLLNHKLSHKNTILKYSLLYFELTLNSLQYSFLNHLLKLNIIISINNMTYIFVIINDRIVINRVLHIIPSQIVVQIQNIVMVHQNIVFLFLMRHDFILILQYFDFQLH